MARGLLVPEQLPPDLAALMESLGITVIWPEGKRFIDSSGGAFT